MRSRGSLPRAWLLLLTSCVFAQALGKGAEGSRCRELPWGSPMSGELPPSFWVVVGRSWSLLWSQVTHRGWSFLQFAACPRRDRLNDPDYKWKPQDISLISLVDFIPLDKAGPVLEHCSQKESLSSCGSRLGKSGARAPRLTLLWLVCGGLAQKHTSGKIQNLPGHRKPHF